MGILLCSETGPPPSLVVMKLTPLGLVAVGYKRVLESYEIKHTVKTDGRD